MRFEALIVHSIRSELKVRHQWRELKQLFTLFIISSPGTNVLGEVLSYPRRRRRRRRCRRRQFQVKVFVY